MGVELVPTPKAPKNCSLAIRLIAKVLSTVHAPVWLQCPLAQNAAYGEHPLRFGVHGLKFANALLNSQDRVQKLPEIGVRSEKLPCKEKIEKITYQFENY